MFVATCGTSPSVIIAAFPEGYTGRGVGNEWVRESPQETAALREDRGGGARWRSTGEAKLVVFMGGWPGPQVTIDSFWTHSGCHKLGRLLLTLRGLEVRGTAKCPTRHKPASSITQREIILTQMS